VVEEIRTNESEMFILASTIIDTSIVPHGKPEGAPFFSEGSPKGKGCDGNQDLGESQIEDDSLPLLSGCSPHPQFSGDCLALEGCAAKSPTVEKTPPLLGVSCCNVNIYSVVSDVGNTEISGSRGTVDAEVRRDVRILSSSLIINVDSKLNNSFRNGIDVTVAVGGLILGYRESGSAAFKPKI
jgi:hypothetical protein